MYIEKDGLRIPLERVSDGSLQKLAIPIAVVSALATLPISAQVQLLIAYSKRFRLSEEQFDLVINHALPGQWKLFGKASDLWGQIYKRIKPIAEADPTSWPALFDFMVAANWYPLTVDFANEYIDRPQISLSFRQYLLQYVSDTCLDKLKTGGKVYEYEKRLLAESLDMQLEDNARLIGESVFRDRLQIALVLKNVGHIKSLWELRLRQEASLNLSDFGEDDDRAERLEALHQEAVAMLPECAEHFADVAISALLKTGRKFMTATLASKLGRSALAVKLYRERKDQLLERKDPFTGWDRDKVGECAYLAGEYSAAYGYFLLTDSDEGMFKSAWEFDKPKAIEIAKRVAAKAISNPHADLHSAVTICLKAGISESTPVYVVAIKQAESTGSLAKALSLAKQYGDQERITRYQLLLNL